MQEKIAEISQLLHNARVKKGLTQRQLSDKTGLPQSHISKIERGDVDLKTSTLIELLRILELELMLVPRNLISVVKAITKQEAYDKKLKPVYRLDEE